MDTIRKDELEPMIPQPPDKKPEKKQVVHLDLSASHAKVSSRSPFAVLEAYKTIRTNLLFSLSSQKSKVVVISSALPGEGKSTTCCNLAVTMAQTGANVLLVDADMRKPVQHKIFRKANQRGLSNLLGGFYAVKDVIFTDVEENLDLIPSGTTPPNPSELLGSENMRQFLDKMSNLYDYIFIDSPPINVVSDATILSDISAGVVLVAKQGSSTYDELDKAVQTIRFAKANILGVVINGTQEKNKGAYSRKRAYKYTYKE